MRGYQDERELEESRPIVRLLLVFLVGSTLTCGAFALHYGSQPGTWANVAYTIVTAAMSLGSAMATLWMGVFWWKDSRQLKMIRRGR